jgi:FkbM family methyltransferase
MQDRDSVRRFARLPEEAGPGPVAFRLRPLGGEPLWLRPATGDVWALANTLLPASHLPPAELREPVRRVWDLGANIGVSMTHLAHCFPGARITGLELDAANAELCRRNIAPWGDRCEVLRAAVWPQDGDVRYRYEVGNEEGFKATASREPGEGDTMVRAAPALSLNTLLARSGGPIDYVKMDIEGTERDVLRTNTEWAAAVRTLKVEVHEPYTVAECVHDLEALGFRAWPDRAHRSFSRGKPPVIALRPGL